MPTNNASLLIISNLQQSLVRFFLFLPHFVPRSLRSVPFFFEPNFDAQIKPLAASLRLQERETDSQPHKRATVKEYTPVVYGDFLMAKVGNNFTGGKSGKY
jgi:hypothetical protein